MPYILLFGLVAYFNSGILIEYYKQTRVWFDGNFSYVEVKIMF